MFQQITTTIHWNTVTTVELLGKPWHHPMGTFRLAMSAAYTTVPWTKQLFENSENGSIIIQKVDNNRNKSSSGFANWRISRPSWIRQRYYHNSIVWNKQTVRILNWIYISQSKKFHRCFFKRSNTESDEKRLLGGWSWWPNQTWNSLGSYEY